MKIFNRLYFDHQATTPVAEQIMLEMSSDFKGGFGNPHSTEHIFGWESANAVEKAAHSVGTLIGADSDEVFFTSGATESNNLALLGLVRNAIKNGDKRKRVVLSAIEHKSILAIGRELEQQYSVRVDILPVDCEGRVLQSDLETVLGDDLLVVSVMVVNNEIGTIQDVKALSEIVHSSGAFFHSDAAQAPMAMDVSNIVADVDLLSLSSHKMYGPKGIGALYIRRDVQDNIEPLFYGGGQQKGLRPGTLPTPLCVGFGAAAEIFNTVEACAQRKYLGFLRDTFVEKLNRLQWPIAVNGPREEFRHPGNINVCFAGFDAEEIISVLQPHLCVSSGSACTSGINEPSHVLKAIGLSSEQAESSIRISLGFDTTEENIEEAVKIIDSALCKISTSISNNDLAFLSSATSEV